LKKLSEIQGAFFMVDQPLTLELASTKKAKLLNNQATHIPTLIA
jgi:hypothetical protein